MSRPATEGDVLATLLLIMAGFALIYVAVVMRTNAIRTDLKAIQPCVGEKK
jgi:hypothetical protein